MLGGMLAVGIPEYRLPKKVLQREIDDIIALGVEVQTGVKIGKDLAFSELFAAGYDAIFLAIGAWQSSPLGIPGDDLPGVIHAIEMLRDVNLALLQGKAERPKIGARVAVVGGGNAAIDAARTALRLGAKEVHIVYRRTRNEMPAESKEIDAAISEGIQMHFLAAPKRVVGIGKVEGLECLRMELKGFDSSGRWRPMPVEGSEFVLPVDTIIAAVGQSVDASLKQGPFEVSRSGQIEVDPVTLATNIPSVYAGGDAVTGPATVIEAIAQGLRAAQAIDHQVRGILSAVIALKDERALLTEEEELIEQPRIPMPELEMCDRLGGFAEVELGYSVEEALAEANRCLKCHLMAEIDNPEEAKA